MKKSRKMAVIISVALVLTLAIGGTLAYLTSTASVTNTFTVGDVDITLDETKVDEDGVPVPGADRVETNEYHLVPGQTYVKDPTTTLKSTSDESYVRMIMTVHNMTAVDAIVKNPIHQLNDYQDLCGDWGDKWTYIDYEIDADKNTISFEFRYNTKVKCDVDTEGNPVDTVLQPLFGELIVPPFVTDEELALLMGGEGQEAFKIVVTGHAIQAKGFENEADAWAAFDAQMKAEIEAANK